MDTTTTNTGGHMNNTWNNAKNRVRQAWEDNPLMVVAIGSAAASAAAQLIKATTEANNSRTWSKEVDRRDRMQTARRNNCGCR